MKKLALAALVALGAGTLLVTPLDAKGSGGGGGGHGFSGHASFRSMPRANIGPLARRGHPVARNIGPLAYRQAYYHRWHHGPRHGHHRRYDYGYGEYGYGGYGYGDFAYGDYFYDDYPYDYAYAGPQTIPDQGVPPPHIVTPAIRTVENSKDVCKSEAVKVPASSGGDATVTIIRC